MSVEDVSRAVIKQLVRGNSGQVINAGWLGVALILRGLPIWLQELLRNRFTWRIT
jgi:hypothetical protein